MPRGVYLCFLILVAIAAVQIAFASTATFVDEQLVPTPPRIEDEMSFPQFRITKSLVSKHLTPEIFEQLKGLKTGHGFTLADAIRSAVEQQDSSVGIYAGDVESYTLFWPLLGPIISDFHKRPLVADLHAVKKEDLWYQHTDWSYMAHLADDDPTLLVDTGSGDKNYILSTRIRLSRNLAHYPLPPALSDEQRHQVEDELKGVLLSMKDVHEELSGNYESISDMTKERVEELEEAHRIFQQEPDRFLHSAGLDGDWPNGRGVFYTDDWTKMVWVNEEDHMRVIALDVKGGSGAFIRAMKDLGQLHEALKQKTSFAFDDMIGYISSCPTNLGTGLRASSHVRLPLVAERAPEQFDAIVAKYHLQKRGLRGEHTESVGGVYDISNQERLGASVVDYVRLVVEGLKELILLEKSLEQQSKI